MVNLGDEFPNFTAQTTEGEIVFHQWLGNSWGILVSHPQDYTPVCTTELGRLVEIIPELDKRNTKLIAISCNEVDTHKGWIKDIQSFIKNDKKFPYPIIADPKRDLAVRFNMLDPSEKDKEGMPFTCRAVFIIGPDKKLKLSMLYPATTGRNYVELLRVLDSLQLTATKNVATPVDWKAGERCMVLPTVKDADIPTLFPKGVDVVKLPSGKPYMRYTPQPDY